ncbi:MAG: NACHT domain-containing protein [Limnothrix sp.]
MATSTMARNLPPERLELMQAAESLIFLLQIPLSEKIMEILIAVQEALWVKWAIAVFIVLAVILTYLVKQSEQLSSFLKNLLQIKTQLKDLSDAPVATDLDTQAERAKLLRAFNIKLEKRLTDVLNNDQLIALSHEGRPKEVGRFQRTSPEPEVIPPPEPTFIVRMESLISKKFWQRPNQPAVELPPNTSMIEVFRKEKERLFILGAPGSGKTTTLLELTKELAAVAETDAQAPVPIIFELSNWKDDRQSIDQWLVAQLKEEFNVEPKVGEHWIATHQILPLLDGLDEVGAERLPKCVAKLNEFLPGSEPDRQAVVCCRTKEFQMGEGKLTGLNGAVELQPLSDGQIQDYLTEMKQPSLWERTIKPSAELRGLARTPLMLTVMAVALVNRPVQTKSELFEAYIEERFARYESEQGKLLYSRRDTRKYLERLAGQLKAENQATFLIEKMQPSWLQTVIHKWAYRLIYGLIFGLIGGLIYGLIGGLIVGLIGGLDNIEPIEILEFSFSRVARKVFFEKLIYGLIYGLIVGLIVGLIGGLIFGLIYGLIYGLIVGLIFGLIEGLKSDITVRTKPNQGILASAKNSLVLTIFGLLLAGGLNLSLSAVLPEVISDPDQIRRIIASSMFTAIYSPLFFSGGLACMQHLALRVVLWRSGAIPLDYAAFLKYTSELRLTRQTGGEFRFFHDLLREHFAQTSHPPEIS